jgi:transcriptional regulator NrdR family protein
MICPKCSGATRVIDSRKKGERTWRRRECIECGFRFNSYETYAKDYNAPKAFIKRWGTAISRR